MNIEIRNRWTDAVILCGEYESVQDCLEKNRYANLSSADLRSANLRSADLSYADLSYADLSYADLSYADLRYADLSSANLRSADLSYADLSYANLSSADLRYAVGVNKYLSTPLTLLLDQPGAIRLYKIVTQHGYGIYRNAATNGLHYRIGETVEVAKPNTDDMQECGAGVNVATLDWCIREWKSGYRILVVEFTAADIACIPIGTDGKIRLSKCKVVGEKNLVELGLPWPERVEASE